MYDKDLMTEDRSETPTVGKGIDRVRGVSYIDIKRGIIRWISDGKGIS